MTLWEQGGACAQQAKVMLVNGTHVLEQICVNTLARGEQLKEKQGYLPANCADDAWIMQN